jgi:hypothetical protein
MKYQVCPTGQAVTTKLGAFGICGAATHDQMTQTISKYGWNVLGTGNDTATAALCPGGGVLYNPSTCTNCGPGAYFDTTTGKCTHCPVNTYKDWNGRKLSDCLACPSGTDTKGTTGVSNLLLCVNPNASATYRSMSNTMPPGNGIFTAFGNFESAKQACTNNPVCAGFIHEGADSAIDIVKLYNADAISRKATYPFLIGSPLYIKN